MQTTLSYISASKHMQQSMFFLLICELNSHSNLKIMRDLPPLPALRAFESAARLGSVTRAAEELHLTHSAISHQIKQLEALIGTPLFEREGKRIALTPAGRVYAYEVRQALSFIAQATQHASRHLREDVLHISLLPSFATHWLIPRLRDWYEKHPNIQLILNASLEVVDFETDKADCAIRMGNISRDGTKQITLMPDWQLLVAGINDPRYHLEQTVEEAINARGFFMIVNDRGLWASQYQTKPADNVPSLSVNDSNLALAVAEQNMCLLLTRWSIAANGIQAGRLKQVSRSMVLHESAYHLVWPDRSNQSHALVLFQNWLIEQCKMFEQFTQLRLKQLDER